MGRPHDFGWQQPSKVWASTPTVLVVVALMLGTRRYLLGPRDEWLGDKRYAGDRELEDP